MRKPDDCDFLNCGMAEENTFDLDGRNVLTTADNDVFDTITDFHISVGVDHSGVAQMVPIVTNRFRRRLWILVVTEHNYIPAHDNLTHRLAIMRNFLS